MEKLAILKLLTQKNQGGFPPGSRPYAQLYGLLLLLRKAGVTTLDINTIITLLATLLNTPEDIAYTKNKN